MRNVFILFALSCGLLSFAQVGIGTTMPDPSSLLDISSTTQGILAPRMTTAQRLAISSPANGLLVYDTTENRFFYFENTTWNSLGTAKRRINYKLVQDISDLSDELAAGGGSVYEMNTNFLYEINGTITVDFPIDINGAYIEGVDSSEDRLFNASGAALFQGSTGGSIRNITLLGNGNELFQVTGVTGSELFIINNTIFEGASKVGTFNGLGTVFLSITQFVNNTDGLDITDIGSFFASNIFWTESNSGTFMELMGTFGNLQMNGGRVVANPGETGIDVSSNPSIVNDATLSQLSFVGDGTPVASYAPANTYPGFNFNRDWNVNSSGISTETDQVASGDINFNFTAGGGAVTTFAANGTPTKLAGTTTSNTLFRFRADGVNRLVYEGKKERFFNVTASISFQGDTNGDRFIFYVAKGSASDPVPTVVDETGVWRQVGGAFDIGALALIGTLELEPGDYIEVWVERFSGTGDIFTVALNLSIR